MDNQDILLAIRGLRVEFETHQGQAEVLDGVDLDIRQGEILGLVGESGCGKSVLARSILRLIPSPPGRMASGTIHFHGSTGDQDLASLSPAKLRAVRGKAISMIFQEPMSSLNPVFTVGSQMREVVRRHTGMTRCDADDLCMRMLARVRLPDPESALRKYPHELSGGMRQRVMIAMELACGPELLIADEPTTALDVTVQGQVLAIIEQLARQRGMSVLFITHDMGVVAQTCDRVAVMYAGRIVETAPVRTLFANPEHPYTRGLIASIPGSVAPGEALPFIPGTVPRLVSPPPGCRFHPRCPEAVPQCRTTVPPLVRTDGAHHAACLRRGPEALS